MYLNHRLFKAAVDDIRKRHEDYSKEFKKDKESRTFLRPHKMYEDYVNIWSYYKTLLERVNLYEKERIIHYEKSRITEMFRKISEIEDLEEDKEEFVSVMMELMNDMYFSQSLSNLYRDDYLLYRDDHFSMDNEMEDDLEFILESFVGRKTNLLYIRPEVSDYLPIVEKRIDLSIFSYYTNSNETNLTFADHYAFGRGFSARIQNNAFDIAVLSTVFSDEYDTDSLKLRYDQKDLRIAQRTLKDNGILLLDMKTGADRFDFISEILRNFDVIGIRTTEHSKILTLKKRTERRSADIKLINDFIINDNLYEGDIYNHAEGIGSHVEITIFRGSEINYNDIFTNYMTNENSAIDNRIEEDNIMLSEEEIKHNLLPFNISQIGLVLTSGYLDGEIEEKNGAAHVICGSTKNDFHETTETDGENVKRTTYSNNTVTINVIDQSGVMHQL